MLRSGPKSRLPVLAGPAHLPELPLVAARGQEQRSQPLPFLGGCPLGQPIQLTTEPLGSLSEFGGRVLVDPVGVPLVRGPRFAGKLFSQVHIAPRARK